MLSYQTLINLRLIAIHNVMDQSMDAYIERAYRYFSKTYSTSLIEAKDRLLPHEVVLIFMEDEMAELKDEELLEFRTEVAPAQSIFPPYNLPEAAAIDDEQWIADQNRLLKQQEEKAKAKKAKEMDEIAKKTHEAIEQLTAQLKKPAKP